MRHVITIKTQYGGTPQIGTIVIPELDENGFMTGNGSIATPERLKKADPDVWLVAGPDRWIVKRKRQAEWPIKNFPDGLAFSCTY